jgi:hypothetical protein
MTDPDPQTITAFAKLIGAFGFLLGRLPPLLAELRLWRRKPPRRGKEPPP